MMKIPFYLEWVKVHKKQYRSSTYVFFLHNASQQSCALKLPSPKKKLLLLFLSRLRLSRAAVISVRFSIGLGSGVSTFIRVLRLKTIHTT